MGSREATDYYLARRGVSSREVVAMIVMALVIGAIALPWLLQQREGSRQRMCEYRLIDLGRTMLFSTNLRKGRSFPGYANPQGAEDAENSRQIGWAFEMLPYIGRQLDKQSGKLPGVDVFGPRNDVHQQLTSASDNSGQNQLPSVFVPEFVCPVDARVDQSQRQAFLSYVANCGMPDAKPTQEFPADWPANGLFLERFSGRNGNYVTSPQFVEDHDGGAYTLMLSENIDAGLWTDTSENQVGFLWTVGSPEGIHTPQCAVLYINQERGKGDRSSRFARPASNHQRGVNVVYCDGHTRFIDDGLEFRIYVAQMTPDGQQVRQPGSDQLLSPPYREIRE